MLSAMSASSPRAALGAGSVAAAREAAEEGAPSNCAAELLLSAAQTEKATIGLAQLNSGSSARPPRRHDSTASNSGGSSYCGDTRDGGGTGVQREDQAEQRRYDEAQRLRSVQLAKQRLLAANDMRGVQTHQENAVGAEAAAAAVPVVHASAIPVQMAAAELPPQGAAGSTTHVHAGTSPATLRPLLALHLSPLHLSFSLSSHSVLRSSFVLIPAADSPPPLLHLHLRSLSAAGLTALHRRRRHGRRRHGADVRAGLGRGAPGPHAHRGHQRRRRERVGARDAAG